MGTLSSQYPWHTIHYRRRYPSFKIFQILSSCFASRLTSSFRTTVDGLAQRLLLSSRASRDVRTGKSAPQARRSGTRRRQHLTSTLKTQKSPWLSIYNPRPFGSCHRLTALSRSRRDSNLPRNSSSRPTRLFSHLGGRVGDRVSSSRAVIQSSSPSLTSCWKPFCVCTRATQGSV